MLRSRNTVTSLKSLTGQERQTNWLDRLQINSVSRLSEPLIWKWAITSAVRFWLRSVHFLYMHNMEPCYRYSHCCVQSSCPVLFTYNAWWIHFTGVGICICEVNLCKSSKFDRKVRSEDNAEVPQMASRRRLHWCKNKSDCVSLWENESTSHLICYLGK